MNVNKWTCSICGKNIRKVRSCDAKVDILERLQENETFYMKIIEHITMHLKMVIAVMNKYE